MSTGERSLPSLGLRAVLIVAVLLASGCAGRAWRHALDEDTPAGYYRFMREHGESRYADAARERLDFHKLKRNPTLSGYEQFRSKYPASELLVALQPALEEPAFEAARAQGTPEAYRAFVRSFPRGRFAAKAEGNAVYVEAEGFGGDAAALGAFAESHPESDFAAEAARTATASAARAGRRIDRLGVVLELSPDTPEPRRVRQALVDRIQQLTDRAGIATVVAPEGADAAALAQLPRARLEVSHREATVETQVREGELARPSRLGTTEVVLREQQGGATIAERRFELRVDDKAHVPGTSVLFSAAAPRFWNQFFVPTARWRNDQAIRPPIELEAPVVDVDAVGDRALVLYENGGFDVVGLADPTQPVRLSSYRRGEDFKRWSGVRVLGSRVAVYGEEGLELVHSSGSGPVAEATWDRGEIGRVLAIAPMDEQIVIAGAKGMQLLDPATGEIRRIMRRVIQGVAAAGPSLVFVDGESVYVSNLELLAENRVIAQMKLGRTFGPNRVRVVDGAAIVTGPGGALVIDVRNPQAPKAVAKLASRQVGVVHDAIRVRGRTFLVGERGALLLNPQLTRVEETIDVGNRNRVAVMGRHFVVASDGGVQVVDAAPWASSRPASASRPAAAEPLLNGTGF